MTLRASAKGSAATHRAAASRGTKWNLCGRRVMSTSACFDFAASNRRRSSRNASSRNFLGGAAVACLVLGCAWTVYANIFAASVYPQLGSANFDAPVVRRPTALADRWPSPPAGTLVAALPEPAPIISAPETVPSGPSLSFDDRFAAAAPQGVAPAPQVEAAKTAEAAKKETSPPPAPAQVAAVAPAPRPKTPGTTVRDMAQRAKAAVMSIAGADKPSIFERLWGKPQSRGSLLAFASADANFTGSLGL